jgi:SAM-dependent methyltransferase
MAADTFQRSCDHWSDDARAEMEAFYELARIDYRYLAETYDWADAFGRLLARDEPLRLADIACGSGKFPEALLSYAGLEQLDGLKVHYDLLDPSDFSVREAKQVLRPPFEAGAEYCCTLQDWDCDAGAYDIAWATHALYCVPAEELPTGLEKMVRCLKPDGLGFVAQGLRDGHYVGFYDVFREALQDGQGTPYSDGAQVEAALRRLGVSVRSRQLNYTTVVSAGREELLESYLQRCAFDDSVSLEKMLSTEPLATYLASCYQQDSHEYHFEQRIGLTLFAHSDARLILRDR